MRQHGKRCQESGFTIIELVISFALIAIMFMGLGAALIGSMAGTADSRRNQQSADIMAKVAEQARNADYASVAVKPPASGEPALTSDPRIAQVSPGVYTADINGNDSGGVEPLLLDAAGTIKAQETINENGAVYTVHRYVTVPADAVNFKRLTTVVRWQQGGTMHERQTSTDIAVTQRGLPLPDFVFKSAMTGLPGGDEPTVDNTSPLDLYVSLTNRGAKDAWTISATGRPWAWEYNQTQGADQSSVTPLVGGTTPLIATDGSAFINIHVDSLPTSTGGPWVITVRATSVAQPSVYKEVQFKVSIIRDCTGCTYIPLFLHNDPESAGCAASPCSPTRSTPNSARLTTDLYADLAAPKWTTTIPDFDTNVSPTGPGRWLLNGGVMATETASTGKVMQWRWDAGSTQYAIIPGKTFKVQLCVKNTYDVANPTATVQVLAQKQSGAPVAMTLATTVALVDDVDDFACTVARPIVLTQPSSTANWTFKGSGAASTTYRKLFLRVVNPSAGAYEVGYDAAAVPAALELPTP